VYLVPELRFVVLLLIGPPEDPFVYVDKIAGFLCLLCHSCHSSANCVGFWGLVIRG